MGSSQCLFSCSIAFKSFMVVVDVTSKVRTPPSKVFTFSLLGMAAMASRKPSTRNRRRLRCVSKMWVALKSTVLPLAANLKVPDTFETQPFETPFRFLQIPSMVQVFCANDCSKYGETQKKPFAKTLLKPWVLNICSLFSGFCSKSLGFKIQPPSWVVQPPPKRCLGDDLLSFYSPVAFFCLLWAFWWIQPPKSAQMHKRNHKKMGWPDFFFNDDEART